MKKILKQLYFHFDTFQQLKHTTSLFFCLIGFQVDLESENIRIQITNGAELN